MGLPIPNLDDRDFAQLMAQARARIAASSPEWSDLGPSDPGITLLEVFAFLTDTLIYRVNRVPEKAYAQFLELIGVTITPPAVASVDLELTLAAPATTEVRIPRGSRVATARADADSPVFATAQEVTIAVGQTSVTVRAHAGEIVEGEELGQGTGAAGQVVRVSRPPISLPTGDVLDLVVGVEAQPEEIGNREAARRLGATTFRIWNQVDHFGAPLALDADRHLYTVDRTEGVIRFAPAAHLSEGEGGLTSEPVLLADVPAAGRRIVAWYRRGGGAHGNVAPRTLTVLKDAIPGVTVSNPRAATGGRDQESLENAMVRGPQSIHSLHRVVTAADYEQYAVSASGGVSRARAVTRADAWVGARAGEVQVFVVPGLGGAGSGPLDRAAVEGAMAPHVLEQLAASLHARAPIGTQVRVTWAGLMRMKVVASVVVHRAEDPDAVAARLHERLDRMLSPVPVGSDPGWPFGEYLRVARVYDVLQSERGVRYVSDVELIVEDVPDAVAAIVRDPHQPKTWFVASGSRVFRTVDHAIGWVVVATFEDEQVEHLAVLPGAPGWVVAVARVGEESSVVHTSADYGETWERIAQFEFHVEQVALALIDGAPHALLATDQGLFRQPLVEGAVADRVTVVDANPAMGCYAVAAVTHPSGALRVAVAAQELKGLYISFAAGQSGTFSPAGLDGEDIRVLKPLEVANRRYLYAAAYATGDSDGFGVARREVLESELDAQGWAPAGTGWTGGSCRDIAFIGETVLAATERAGVAVTNPRQQDGIWRTPTRDCGLPLRASGTFQALTSVGADDAQPPLALCGGPEGIYRSPDGRSWELASPSKFRDQVALPPNWLFAPGEHQITVRFDDAG